MSKVGMLILKIGCEQSYIIERKESTLKIIQKKKAYLVSICGLKQCWKSKYCKKAQNDFKNKVGQARPTI